ncbi:Mono- and diacylglycerol lipase [Leucoagaricus sp. SymC.cos]|nr:Mono- and diacylglycerol lipase [Leucoagaricus sp. SymC.cos]
MLGPLFTVCTFIGAATAGPSAILNKRGVTPLSSGDLAALAPYTQFARAAYCSTDSLKNWSCGEACDALSGFQPTLVGGDGNAVQIYANILTDPLDTSLFPGVSSDVVVHDGFRNEHALTASQILDEVKKLTAERNTNSVTCIGHSLGGALAELDAVFFSLNLPSSTDIRAFTYGTPRVGNLAWAQLVNAKVPNFKRINNERDIVPIVPGRFLGFGHPAGEIHIVSPGNAVSCPGDDDATDDQCIIKTVPNIFEGNILNHLGPYEGVPIGTIFCT